MIVEDGSIVPDADSLVDLAFADAYADARFNIQWEQTADKEASLVLGTSWILNRNRGNWKGYIVDPTQPLAWPRMGVIDADGREIAINEIPVQLKQAIVEAAIRFGRGDDLDADPTSAGTVKSTRVRVGPIEEAITYAEGTTLDRPTVNIVDDLLYGLVTGSRAGKVRLLKRWF